MAESLFIKVDEVGELLGISRAEAYRIIKKLNSELAEKGYIVISGTKIVNFFSWRFVISHSVYLLHLKSNISYSI